MLLVKEKWQFRRCAVVREYFNVGAVALASHVRAVNGLFTAHSKRSGAYIGGDKLNAKEETVEQLQTRG